MDLFQQCHAFSREMYWEPKFCARLRAEHNAYRFSSCSTMFSSDPVLRLIVASNLLAIAQYSAVMWEYSEFDTHSNSTWGRSQIRKRNLARFQH
eukprot:scaffold104_cov143-Skeletonema_marinoi.AAC.6